MSRDIVTGKWVKKTPCCGTVGICRYYWQVVRDSFAFEMVLCPRCEAFTYCKIFVSEGFINSRLDSKRVTLKEKKAIARVFPELRERLGV